ncbi:MAG: pyridoxamine 5'-phosphate oxidase family protein [Thiovulaceae bacterium]|nr:pyridoxamine 5'-phosphate oxidase family protein [Sulfurimonadaceae bacterium]
MRRKDFEVDDRQRIEELLAETEYGVLSLIADGEPYGLALNFVYFEEKIYFHGAKEGRKVEAMMTNPQASFLVVQPHSLIPSYFSNTRSACPATQLYSSVHIFGDMSMIKESIEKARILNALMQKLQSEGGYDAINADNPIYTKMLEQTGLYVLTPKTMSLKIKVGQNLSEERKRILIKKLRERNEDKDEMSAALVEEFMNS